MEEKYNSSDDSSDDKKAKRRKQKRDYATRRRQRDKDRLVSLSSAHKNLDRRSRQQRHEIQKLMTWEKYARSYLSLCVQMVVCQHGRPGLSELAAKSLGEASPTASEPEPEPEVTSSSWLFTSSASESVSRCMDADHPHHSTDTDSRSEGQMKPRLFMTSEGRMIQLNDFRNIVARVPVKELHSLNFSAASSPSATTGAEDGRICDERGPAWMDRSLER